MENKPIPVRTSIQFAPICGNCHKLLAGSTIEVVSNVSFSDSVSPARCPLCGALFESIEMPTKLPYNYMENHSWIKRTEIVNGAWEV